MKNANVANFLWVGTQLSLYEKKCIESFIANGFIVNVYAYEPLDIPEGANLLDGRAILPESEVYAYTQGGKKGSPASFANVFRYQLLKLRAGWWFDADIFCLKNVKDWIALAETRTGSVVIGWEDGVRVNNAVLLSDNADFDACVQKHVKDVGKSVAWGQLGPKLITKVIKELKMEDAMLSDDHFYPIHYNEFEKMLDPAESERCANKASNSYCVHLWNEFINRYAIPKNLPPPNNSFLFKLFSMHGALNSDIALPFATCKALCESSMLPELKAYQENIESMPIVKFYRALKRYARKLLK